MNRQEAIDRLKNEVKRIEEIMKNGDYGCVDMDTWNKFAKKAEWRETLIELLTGPTPDPITGLRGPQPDPITGLRSPTPDPITGLVPCGCGGKAGFHYSVMMRDNDCYVESTNRRKSVKQKCRNLYSEEPT